MNTVITVKDFTLIWDAYATFEDTLIAAQLNSADSKKKKKTKQHNTIIHSS